MILYRQPAEWKMVEKFVALVADRGDFVKEAATTGPI